MKSATLVGALWLLAATLGRAGDGANGDSPIKLEAVQVKESYAPKLSFGLSLEVWKDNETGRIRSLVITAVKPGTDAEAKGLTARTKVYRIDGRGIEEYAATFMKGSELNHLFVNRDNSAGVILEVAVPGEAQARSVTLVERHEMVPSTARLWEKLTHP